MFIFLKRADKVSGNEGRFMKKWKTVTLDLWGGMGYIVKKKFFPPAFPLFADIYIYSPP